MSVLIKSLVKELFEFLFFIDNGHTVISLWLISCNSEAKASELLKNLEEMLPLYFSQIWNYSLLCYPSRWYFEDTFVITEDSSILLACCRRVIVMKTPIHSYVYDSITDSSEKTFVYMNSYIFSRFQSSSKQYVCYPSPKDNVFLEQLTLWHISQCISWKFKALLIGFLLFLHSIEHVFKTVPML